MKRARKLKLATAGLACLLLLGGCGQVYVDPGPNPARVRVELKAQVPASYLRTPTEWVYWDWGLYLLVPQGPMPLLKPAQPQKFKVIANVNPLARNTVFLAPPGRHTFRLLVSGYVFRTRGDGSIPVTLLNFSQDFKLDLPPGGSSTIKKSLGAAR